MLLSTVRLPGKRAASAIESDKCSSTPCRWNLDGVGKRIGTISRPRLYNAPLRALRHCSGVERSRPTEAKRFPRYRDEEETDGFQKEKNEWMEMKGEKREGKGREGKGRKKRGEDGRNGSWDGSISASVVGRGFGMRKVHFPR